MKISYKGELQKLTKAKIIDYCDVMASNWWNLQNNWMLNISKDYGSETAAKYDALVLAGMRRYRPGVSRSCSTWEMV